MAYEVVAHRLIGMLEIHNDKLDAILEAATVEPGPSPTTEILKQILVTMQEQTTLLQGLPDAIGKIVREELRRNGSRRRAMSSAKNGNKPTERMRAGRSRC